MGKASVARKRLASAVRDRLNEAMVGAPAGWYFDPHDEAIYRFWDGGAWTEHCSDLVTGPPIDLTSAATASVRSTSGGPAQA